MQKQDLELNNLHRLRCHKTQPTKQASTATLRLLMITIVYLKPYTCMQTNNYYQTEIISWKHIIISIR